MSIHREGTGTILVVLSALFIINLLVFIFVKNAYIKYPVLGLSIIFLGIILQFFRYPKRVAEQNEDLILSPCDGKVVVIEEVYEPEYFKDKRIQVSIFMSPLNVHINWSPVTGTIAYYKYHEGKYLVAFHPKSSVLNERTSIAYKTNNGKELLMRQIAGFIARRIVCYAEPEMQATQGDEIGFIKFGSRVDLFLPLDTEILVNLDDVTRGNITKIAKWK